MRILLVEDDELIGELLVKSLTSQHYTVDFAQDGQEGWDLAELYTYDLILLDLILPKLDGISFCRRLRAAGNQTPILLLTAQDTSTIKVKGLDAGADDYVAKPFDFQELLARIRALLRRGGSALPPLLEWNNLRLDPSTCEVTCDEKLLHLTPKEYGLLELFLRNSHRIFSCSALIDHLWSFEEPPTEDTVRSHIKGLRQKLKASGVAGDPIDTVYGIGYRLKPAQVVDKEESTTEKVTANASAASQVESGVTKIWGEVVEKIEERVAVIEQASSKLLQNKASEEIRSKAKLEAHKLVGSLGMFGSDEGSRLAQEIESLLDNGKALKPAAKKQLGQVVGALRQELQNLKSGSKLVSLPVESAADDRPLVLIIDQDQKFAEEVAKEINNQGLRVEIASDAIASKQLIAKNSPNFVLLDLSTTDNPDNSLNLLAELSNRTPPIPVVVLTAEDSLLDRVKVAHLGGRGILLKPVTPSQVLETVNQTLQQSHTTEARVMIVDDDPQILTALQALLSPWGIKVYTLDDPQKFLAAMQYAKPELLIIDMEMAGISGVELCQIARKQPQWTSLPILFLTTHNDTATRHQIFAVGADDYINKPIVEPELLARILNRLERTRWLRSLAEIDTLTFVANRRKSTQELNKHLQWSETHNKPFSLAIVELDDLKQINYTYGHEVGDRVLSRLGEILKHNFHNQDVVGRWGGTEFVVGMPVMTKHEAVRRLVEILKEFRQIKFTGTNHQSFHATFSAAVVVYPQDGDKLEALYQAADALLKQAKVGGRNRVF
ncbi:response regulator [Nostoc sp. MS1]|uniref:response regulator n=1 Tax=Nostoc sp. MS1 TaxID=2764711 RepID=UPI001CC7DCB6|nr:response regulator [Nostoc sp. MS1]BCL35269.1 transcriptional regulator [Nostoc sp. MS1]